MDGMCEKVVGSEKGIGYRFVLEILSEKNEQIRKGAKMLNERVGMGKVDGGVSE